MKNMPLSTNNSWYFDKKELKSTPSIQDGLDYETELRYVSLLRCTLQPSEALRRLQAISKLSHFPLSRLDTVVKVRGLSWTSGIRWAFGSTPSGLEWFISIAFTCFVPSRISRDTLRQPVVCFWVSPNWERSVEMCSNELRNRLLSTLTFYSPYLSPRSAGKVEETPKKCKDLIHHARALLDDVKFAQFGESPREEVMTLERILLQTMNFDLQVDHSYSYLLK